MRCEALLAAEISGHSALSGELTGNLGFLEKVISLLRSIDSVVL